MFQLDKKVSFFEKENRPLTKQKLASKNVTYSNQIYTDRRRIIKNFTSRTIAYFPPSGFMISK